MFGIVKTLVNIIFGIIEFLLFFRFIFVFFVVNSNTPFVAWIYNATDPLVRPFAKILPDLNVGGLVVDFAILVALIVYAFIGYLILQLFSYVGPSYRRDS